MISFRYHIVSIVAVFLALALGIVIGTTALSGPITRDLRKQVNDGKAQRNSLDRQVKTLQGEIDDAGQFATSYGAKLVAGTLSGKKVIEIVLPGATTAMRSGIDAQLAAAGATVNGRVTITDDYLDSSRGSGIISLATGASRPMTTLPETNDPGQLGGALLAYALMGKASASDTTSVLGSFSELHMISLDGSTIAPTPNIVVIAHGAPSTPYAGSAEQSLIAAMVKAPNAGKIVVAGDLQSAGNNGIIGQVRSSGATNEVVSTVDNADSSFGQVSTALALAGVLKGTVGQYGTGTGAQTLFPSPAN